MVKVGFNSVMLTKSSNQPANLNNKKRWRLVRSGLGTSVAIVSTMNLDLKQMIVVVLLKKMHNINFCWKEQEPPLLLMLY